MSRSTLKIMPDSPSGVISYSGNYRIFSNDSPITDALRVLSISDDVSPGTGDLSYIKRYFRYSLDRRSWSAWYQFVPDGSPAEGMYDIEIIQMNPDSDLYLEYKYEYDDGTFNPLDTPIIVNWIKTVLELRSIAPSIDSGVTVSSNCTAELCPGVVFDRDATFNPYDVGSFVGLYAETSLFVNKTFGLPVVYFRTLPAAGGGDYIFKEWNLFNVVERKCIKVVVPNNDFPDSKLHYNEFGIDYEVPFEVHIDKRYFEMMFNPAAEVRKKDFLYFPMLNRMFEIQGSYMFRGLMMAPLYWKAQLVKFKPNINYIMKAEDTLFLDNLLLDSEETLSQIANGDVRDAILPDQYKTISSRFDETRSSLNDSLLVRQERYYFNYAQLIDYYYDLSARSAAGETAVAYKKQGVFGASMPNITYTAMFNARVDGAQFTIIESKKAGSPDPNIGVSVTGALTGTALVITVRMNNRYVSRQFTGVSLSKWYAVIIQMSTEFKQLCMFLYAPIEDTADALNHNEMRLVGQYVLPITQADEFDTGSGYELKHCPLYLANLRVYNTFIRFEDHQYALSQLFVRDESLLYLIDNCRPQLNAPIISRVR